MLVKYNAFCHFSIAQSENIIFLTERHTGGLNQMKHQDDGAQRLSGEQNVAHPITPSTEHQPERGAEAEVFIMEIQIQLNASKCRFRKCHYWT